jgi:GDPmannose 4,6-dehydratase
LTSKIKLQFIKLLTNINQRKFFTLQGQSSIPKSLKRPKETFQSHYNGTKNFLDVLKEKNLKIKFFKANSGYIFAPNKGRIDLNCNFSSNKNPYVKAQKKSFSLLKKYREFGLNLSNLVFMQVEVTS